MVTAITAAYHTPCGVCVCRGVYCHRHSTNIKLSRLEVNLLNQRTSNKRQIWSTHHEVLPCQADRLDGALNVDCRFLLGAVGVREVDLGTCPLGDVLDVAAVAALHEEVVLRRDVQVGGDRDGACQATGQVLQQQSRAPLRKHRRRITDMTDKLYEYRKPSASCYFTITLFNANSVVLHIWDLWCIKFDLSIKSKICLEGASVQYNTIHEISNIIKLLDHITLYKHMPWRLLCQSHLVLHHNFH